MGEWTEVDRVEVLKHYGEFLGLKTLRRPNYLLTIARFAHCDVVVGQQYLDAWKDAAAVEYAIANAKPEISSE